MKYYNNGDTLASDCYHREDLLWLKYGNNEYSQRWKLRNEEVNRDDRKLRQ